MSGQVDSQVFVCISDFAGWPQVGKLLKGFTLLPNFLLHKRGTITTSNLVGISIVSKRCFFQLLKKGYFSALSLLIFVLPLVLMVFNQNLQCLKLDITQNSDNILHTDFISSARPRCGGKGGKEEGCERGQGDQFGEYPSFCQLDFYFHFPVCAKLSVPFSLTWTILRLENLLCVCIFRKDVGSKIFGWFDFGKTHLLILF